MQEIIGAIKIKDGLFMGDQYAAQDLEFVVGNKVTHIINCVGKQVPNHWEPIGVKYLTFTWVDSPSQTIFDQHDKTISKIFSFINSAEDECTSVLVHCLNGLGKSVVVIAAYLMKRFSWSLYKSLQFLNSRRGKIELKSHFISQLAGLEQRLARQGLVNKSNQWTSECEDSEEQVLQNTFLNCHIEDSHLELAEKKTAKRVKFNEGEESLKKENDFVVLKSCMKGGNKEEILVPKNSFGPKRSSSLNLPKGKVKGEVKKQHDKNLSMFEDILKEEGKTKKTGKRPLTAPDKKGKKGKGVKNKK